MKYDITANILKRKCFARKAHFFNTYSNFRPAIDILRSRRIWCRPQNTKNWNFENIKIMVSHLLNSEFPYTSVQSFKKHWFRNFHTLLVKITFFLTSFWHIVWAKNIIYPFKIWFETIPKEENYTRNHLLILLEL